MLEIREYEHIHLRKFEHLENREDASKKDRGRLNKFFIHARKELEGEQRMLDEVFRFF